VGRVEVEGRPPSPPQRSAQGARGWRTPPPRHVLDAEDLRPGLLELPRQVDVVAEVPLRTSGIEQIARVAHRRLAEGARATHGVDRDAHVVDAVERVADAEEVHAG